MSSAQQKLKLWRSRDQAIEAAVIATMERAEAQIKRHAAALRSIADSLQGRGIADLAVELRSETKLLEQLLD